MRWGRIWLCASVAFDGGMKAWRENRPSDRARRRHRAHHLGKRGARGSVSRVLSGGSPRLDGHSSRATVTSRLKQPTRATGRIRPMCRPYSVLLPVGFAVPPPLLEARCALTAPFHPCRPKPAVCSLWHFPWGHPRRALPGTVDPWSPDFPPRRPFGTRRGGRPILWPAAYIGPPAAGSDRLSSRPAWSRPLR